MPMRVASCQVSRAGTARPTRRASAVIPIRRTGRGTGMAAPILTVTSSCDTPPLALLSCQWQDRVSWSRAADARGRIPMSYHHGDLRRAMVAAAATAVAERGPAGLSLRELARLAGVSHAAPAHHFGDK